MSFSSSTIENALYAWASGVSGKTTIWRNQNAPAPSAPYMTLFITNFVKVGWDYQTQTNDDGKAALMGNRELNLEINYYGTGGLDVFEKLTTSLQTEIVSQTLTASGLFYFDKVMQENISGLDQSTNGFEERYIMELRFRYSNQGITDPDLFDTNIIQTTEVLGESTGPSGDTIETELNIGEPYIPPP